MSPIRDRLRIAVQKSGRLADASLDLLRRAGLAFRASRDRLFLYGENLPVDVLLVRDDDIPGLLVEGSCELGIVGRNVLEEARLEVGDDFAREQFALGFGACRLALAVPQDEPIDAPEQLAGLRIATSYPAQLGAWLAAHGIKARIVQLSGSVEIAPRLGKADAICDLVQTGSTLVANRLREIGTVMHSEAVLAIAPHVPAAVMPLAERLMARISGTLQGADARLVMMRAPRAALDAIRRVLPASDPPNVLGLDGEPDTVAMQALCSVAPDWPQLEELRRLGARSVMVLNVERMLG